MKKVTTGLICLLLFHGALLSQEISSAIAASKLSVDNCAEYLMEHQWKFSSEDEVSLGEITSWNTDYANFANCAIMDLEEKNQKLNPVKNPSAKLEYTIYRKENTLVACYRIRLSEKDPLKSNKLYVDYPVGIVMISSNDDLSKNVDYIKKIGFSLSYSIENTLTYDDLNKVYSITVIQEKTDIKYCIDQCGKYISPSKKTK